MLQLLAAMRNDINPVQTDTAYLNTIKELRESNLLLKEDIQEYDLLYYACKHGAQFRFDYFVDWDAEGLKNHQYGGMPIIHAVIFWQEIEHFKVFFKAALKHYTQRTSSSSLKRNTMEKQYVSLYLISTVKMKR